MIDWLKVRLLSAPPIAAGRVVSIDADGAIEWQSERRVCVEGSYSSKVQVRNAYPSGLEFDGNPAKFLQGHNVFGSEDLHALVVAFVTRVAAVLGVDLGCAALSDLARGVVVVARVDIARGFKCGSRKLAHQAVAVLRDRATIKYRGAPSNSYRDQTVYFAQNSRRSSVKAYAKGAELELPRSRLHEDLPFRDHILAEADDVLRIELTLRSMELKRLGLDLAANWSTLGITPADLLGRELAKLSISDLTMRNDQVAELPARLQVVHQLWKDGHDVRQIVSRASYFRYRSELRKHGIDIAVTPPRREQGEVFRLSLVLTATEAPVPAWAVGTPAYFEPKAA